MSTEHGKLIGIKLSFQMNHASICGIMMTAFVLDQRSMLVNAAFLMALSVDIVAEQSELWSWVLFRIINDPICYKLRVISIASGTP